jgi:hypothetical protein
VSEQTYYIARARCYETKYFDGQIATRDDEEIVLGWSNEGGGWPQCTRLTADAYRFKSPEEAEKSAHRWDGMPWYYRLKPGTLRVAKVTEKRSYERSEEPVERKDGNV